MIELLDCWLNCWLKGEQIFMDYPGIVLNDTEIMVSNGTDFGVYKPLCKWSDVKLVS